MYNIYVKLTTDNTNTAAINFKELYNCKWDLMTSTNNTLNTPAFKFLNKYFDLHGPKLVTVI
jgi:hypothetical protein